MARVGHSDMTADELTENIEAAVKAVVDKIRMVSVAGGVFLLSDWLKKEAALFKVQTYSILWWRLELHIAPKKNAWKLSRTLLKILI